MSKFEDILSEIIGEGVFCKKNIVNLLESILVSFTLVNRNECLKQAQ